MEVRVGGTDWYDPRWHDPAWQPGVAIIRSQLIARRGLVKVESVPLVNVSMHALARWFERSGRRDFQSLMHDPAPLPMDSTAERVPTGSGYWASSIQVVHGTDDRWFQLGAYGPNPTPTRSLMLNEVSCQADLVTNRSERRAGMPRQCRLGLMVMTRIQRVWAIERT
jgi:hypothetical protein